MIKSEWDEVRRLLQETKPLGLWDRIRLFFRRTYRDYGFEFKVMDGDVWIIKEASGGKG